MASLTVLHFVAVFQYLFAIYYDMNYVEFPERKNVPDGAFPKFGGKAKFLTYWCLVSFDFLT